jgi:hypothetical protein
MSVNSILNLLNKLNKVILCELLANIIFFLLLIQKKEYLMWKRIIFQWHAYSVTLTFSPSLHCVCIMQMTSRQNICTVMQYPFHGVAESAQVCDKTLFWLISNLLLPDLNVLNKQTITSTKYSSLIMKINI